MQTVRSQPARGASEGEAPSLSLAFTLGGRGLGFLPRIRMVAGPDPLGALFLCPDCFPKGVTHIY